MPISRIESQLREKLAILHRVINHFGWDDLLATHISAKISAQEVLISPHNVPFDEVNEDNIVKVNLSGDIISNNNYCVIQQALNIHLECYKKRNDINCIIHTHSDNGVAVSALECGFLFFNQQALRFYDDISYHAYDGLALDNEGVNIANSLGEKSILILKNHGLITTANTIESTIYKHYYLEKCMDIQLKTLSTNKEIAFIPENVCKTTREQFRNVETPDIEFNYFKRLVNNHR